MGTTVVSVGKFLLLYLLASVFAYVFVTSGLIVSILSILLLPMYTVAKSAYRRLTSALAYTVLGQIVWLCTDYGDLRIHIYGENEVYDKFGKESALIASNHKGDVDWIAGFVLGAYYHFLHNIRSLPKASVFYVPGFGQLLWALEYPFLMRNNYQKDVQTISKISKVYRHYPFPIQVVIYCEGTRFTEEKYKKGLEYIKKHDLPPLKYHLPPRTKGFALLAEHLREGGNFKAVYDICVAYPDGYKDPVPTHLDLLLGKRVEICWLMRRIPMEDLPATNEELNTFCYELFQQKDVAYEHFLEKKEFPAPRQVLPPFENVRLLLRVIIFVWFVLLVVVPLILMCLTFSLFTTALLLGAFGLFNGVFLAVLLITNKSQTSKKKDD